MMWQRTRWSGRPARLCLPLLLLLLLPASPGVAEEPAFAWFPLDSGRRVILVTERERSLRTGTGTQRAGFQGRSEISVGGKRGVYSPLARLESESPTGLAGARQATISQRIEIYSSSSEQLLLHSLKDVGGTDQQIRYEPPRVLLQAPLVKGSTWTVGELLSGKLRLDLEAEVLGIEPLEVGGRKHPKTLRVRYSGSVSGRADGAEVRAGTYERVTWFAKGTGIVQETIRIDLELPDQAGGTMAFTDLITLRLEPPQATPKSVLR